MMQHGSVMQTSGLIGSLEEEKFADYVILAEDPITRRNPVGMRDIPVLETWVGGIRMHQRKN